MSAKPKALPMAQRIEGVQRRMADDLDHRPATPTEIAVGMNLSVSSTLATLLLMERRGLAVRAGTTPEGYQLWRLP